MKKDAEKLELLAPAGSFETFQAVLAAGADAVYLGGNAFGARAYANNFSETELLQAIDLAHIHGRQIYLTINTLFKEQELEGQLYDYLLPYYKQGLDAVIVQDIGAFQFIRQEFPGLDIHTSTQMTVTNRYGAQLMKEMGATRVVTAREMSFAEIRDIADHVDIEIESFIHGALCYCFSGQCLLSSMLGGRSGNRGRCAQPCRLPYEVLDAKKKRISRTDKPYVLSPKDLCTIEYLPQLAAAGIYSFKIEGRMKQAEYAAGVVSVYRNYMDAYLADGAKNYRVSDADMRMLYDFGNRSGFTKGYYEQHNGKEMITFEKPNHAKGNEALQAKIRENYLQTETKEKINGILRLKKDLPANMEVTFQGNTVSCSGDVVQAAVKQPLSIEKIAENARKTGNTPFEFEALEIAADTGIFLPMKALNQLRRDTLDALCEKLTEKYRRREHKAAAVLHPKTSAKAAEQPQLSVSIEDRKQLSCLLQEALVQSVYLDSGCYRRADWQDAVTADVAAIRAAGKEAFYVLPSVFRKRASDFYHSQGEFVKGLGLTGVVVKSYDALAFVQTEWQGIPFLCDQGLYTYNNRAISVLNDAAPLRLTAPFELNRRELLHRNNENSELYLYGMLPLMTSAQCVHANVAGCDHTPSTVYLKDRYGKHFPVKNHCMECYNTVYNTTPLMLFGYGAELKAAGFASFRLAFTVEDEAAIHEILTLYRSVFLEETRQLKDVYTGDYTNGHYKEE